MPVINPLEALVHLQTQKKKKKLSCMDCQSPTQLLRIRLFRIRSLGIVDFNLPRN